jgi:sensor domain CHASE-containing protein
LSRRILYVITGLLACGLLLAAYVAEHVNQTRYETAVRAAVHNDLGRLRDSLEGNLNSDIQLVRGLISLIALNPDIDQQRLDIAARPLFEGRSQLRNLAVAPDMVIRMVYPKLGNERRSASTTARFPSSSWLSNGPGRVARSCWPGRCNWCRAEPAWWRDCRSI